MLCRAAWQVHPAQSRAGMTSIACCCTWMKVKRGGRGWGVTSKAAGSQGPSCTMMSLYMCHMGRERKKPAKALGKWGCTQPHRPSQLADHHHAAHVVQRCACRCTRMRRDRHDTRALTRLAHNARQGLYPLCPNDTSRHPTRINCSLPPRQDIPPSAHHARIYPPQAEGRGHPNPSLTNRPGVPSLAAQPLGSSRSILGPGHCYQHCF